MVLDNTNTPIPNVTLRVTGTSLMTTTDAQGQFSIPGAPIGHVHLLVDGRTTTRPGTWPTLPFDLMTISGLDNTAGMPIFLLPIDTGNGKIVGGPQDVILTLADVPGFQVTVFANSVTCPDGTHQCLASLTQVHRDKVPMPPPRGAAPRLVLTVQPPGIHFDPPARVSYPNVDGLPPGYVSDFYSFDHGLGQFVTVGTAEVTADGSAVVSFAGGGIRDGGWHFPQPPPPPPGCSSNCDDHNACTVDDGDCPNCRHVPIIDSTCCNGTGFDPGTQGCCDVRNDQFITVAGPGGLVARQLTGSTIVPTVYSTLTLCCRNSEVLQQNPIADINKCPDRVADQGAFLFFDGCSLPLSDAFRNNPTGGTDTQFGNSSYTGPCDQHDRCYQRCYERASQADLDDVRSLCDLEFLTNATDVCERTQDGELTKQKCFFYAGVYFGGLRALGGSAIRDNQRYSCQCCPPGTT
ncbi:MAG: hypothetical protein DMF51_05890 [Acidobacteria bacterium]|nr:MAG: hypothetical protein DMF51_05890 [Acidobacteriota bacterium]